MPEKAKPNTVYKRSILSRIERWSHPILFTVVWGVAFTVPYLGMLMVIAANEPAGWIVVHLSWLSLLPYFVLSFINEFVLEPLFFVKKRIALYIIGLLLAMTAFTFYQTNFCDVNLRKRYETHLMASNGISLQPPQYIKSSLYIGIPLLSRISIALLVVGIGLAYTSVRTYKRRLKRAMEIETERLEQEVVSLRAQMAPHFFLNMLNNIHSAMEMDARQAQKMLIRLSKMMHYVTYDTTHPFVRLSSEVDFLNAYIELMSFRYPSDRVEIKTTMPSPDDVTLIHVAPLIFINFAENAFKHGVSYRHHSFVNINLEILNNKRLRFTCVNSLYNSEKPEESAKKEHTGIGLKNIKRRLEVLYGTEYSLAVYKDNETNTFNVELEIPVNET